MYYLDFLNVHSMKKNSRSVEKVIERNGNLIVLIEMHLEITILFSNSVTSRFFMNDEDNHLASWLQATLCVNLLAKSLTSFA